MSRQVVVAKKRVEAEGVISFDLVDPQGEALPPFEPGAHIDVHLPNGLTRQYSLLNSARERHRYCIAVLREPASRGGSEAMHALVHEGDLLNISEPRNKFPLAVGNGPVILLAGGIGITPLLSMADALSQGDADFALHYCARTSSRMAFKQQLSSGSLASRVRLHMDDGPVSQRLDLSALCASPCADAHLYVCGPGGFIDAALDAARTAGWTEHQLHLERFGAQASAAGERTFEMRIASSGQSLTVPADRTALEVLRDAGIDVPSSCETGVCGTCVVHVLEGLPDHRDCFLMPQEHARNDRFTPCCSRSISAALVLDL